MFGQDRYRRRYWILPQCGGIFVEGMESGEGKNCQSPKWDIFSLPPPQTEIHLPLSPALKGAQSPANNVSLLCSSHTEPGECLPLTFTLFLPLLLYKRLNVETVGLNSDPDEDATVPFISYVTL